MSDFETMAKERFHEISTLAWDCKPLPEKFIFKCDVQLYDDLSNLYTGHRRDKLIDKKEVIARGFKFRAAYITQLGKEMLHYRTYELDQERYKRLSELRNEIIKTSEEKTDFELLQMFVELFGKVFTDAEAKVLSDNINKRSDSYMTPIAEENAGIMIELLLLLRVNGKVAEHMFEDAREKGVASYNGFVVRPSSENKKKFKLYHAPICMNKKE